MTKKIALPTGDFSPKAGSQSIANSNLISPENSTQGFIDVYGFLFAFLILFPRVNNFCNFLLNLHLSSVQKGEGLNNLLTIKFGNLFLLCVLGFLSGKNGVGYGIKWTWRLYIWEIIVAFLAFLTQEAFLLPA
ncbi:MAG: hypothetical protein JSR80_02725 [Verrucomicrobia bacterium]|nr:hypothetical protein [Verrucomicrobiota bacterium]